MANICSNELRINFLDNGISEDNKNWLIDAFEEKFSYDYFEVLNPETANQDDYADISMGSRWASPDVDNLKEFADMHNLHILGVSWDFSGEYVNSFDVKPE